MPELVSVLLSTYSEPVKYVEKAVNSILGQSYSNIQLIIICDKPDNQELIDVLQNICVKDPRCELHVNEKNLGLVKSLNSALSFVKGSYIARMDADDYSLPDRIEKQLDYLKKNQLDLVGCNLYNLDPDDQICSGVISYPETDKLLKKKAKYSSPLAHPTFLGKKKVFNELNGYQNIHACEDYDFLVRAILSGFKLGCLQEPLFNYRINPNGVSSLNKAKQKTSFYFVCKNYRAGKMITESDYEDFINSPKGKKKYDGLNSYYNKKAQIIGETSKSFSLQFKRLYAILSSKEGFCLFWNSLKEKIFVR